MLPSRHAAFPVVARRFVALPSGLPNAPIAGVPAAGIALGASPNGTVP